jgi:hypothetical protein
VADPNLAELAARPSRARRRGLAVACAVLLAAGCASTTAAESTTSPHPTTGPSRTAGALTAAERRALAARYLMIARPANRKLDHDFDGLKDHEDDDLAAADADLRDAAATERRFDHQLLAITFPPPTEQFVRLLFEVNQARAALAATVAASMSLRQLLGYQPRLTAANEPVEQAVRVIRSQLGLPPPDTS